jgi:hypothetical protein
MAETAIESGPIDYSDHIALREWLRDNLKAIIRAVGIEEPAWLRPR